MKKLLSFAFFLCLLSLNPVWGQELIRLETNKAIAKTLANGDQHNYELELDADQFVLGDANQVSVDVVVSVFDPNNELVGRYDNPARGPESFQFNSKTAGKYRIEITPFEDEEGDYVMRLHAVEALASSPEGKVDQMMIPYRGTDKPGAVIGVMENGEISFAKGYGMANLEYEIPNAPQTVFHMASISKQFTAFAIVMLAEQGKLSIDDEVHQYLPDLPDFGTPITLRHLMNHTSGLRDHWSLWSMSGGLMDDVIRQEDLMRLVRRQKELNFEPGAEYLYSNAGYLVLSEVVAAVTEQSLGEWLQANVFEPLEMNSSQIYDDHERIVKGRAYSYRPDGDGYKKSVLSYANSGATSLFTTAGDMCKWMWNFHTMEVGGKAVMDQMLERGILNSGDTLDYALGLVIGEHRGLKRIGHGGADAGYRTQLFYFPEINSGVIVMSNLGFFNPYQTAHVVADAFFEDKLEPVPVQNTNGENNPDEETEPWNPGLDELRSFEGTYYSEELDTYYYLEVEDGQLTAKHTRHGWIPLSPKEENYFQGGAWFFSEIQFHANEAGEVSSMRVSNGRVRNLFFEKRE